MTEMRIKFERKKWVQATINAFLNKSFRAFNASEQ